MDDSSDQSIIIKRKTHLIVYVDVLIDFIVSGFLLRVNWFLEN